MIECVEVSKSFGKKKVLDQVNLVVERGKIQFVLGRSGTGKSVLLKCIVGLHKADSGSLFVEDEDVTNFDEERFLKIRQKVAMVFQSSALLDSLPVFENIAMAIDVGFPKIPKQERESRAVQALKQVGLGSRWLPYYPREMGFAHTKRVAIARSLALWPKCFLFDEPTTGLDPVATATINNLIKELNQEFGMTAVVVSHDLSSAFQIAHKVCLLDQGRVVFNSTPDEFRSDPHPLAQAFMREVQ